MSYMNLRLRAVLTAILCATPAVAQNGGVEVDYGSWWRGERATVVSAALYKPIAGALSWGVGVIRIEDQGSSSDRNSTGAEVTLAIGRSGSGMHFIGSVALVQLDRESNFDAIWSVGAGYSVSPFSFVTLGVDARYRLEDRRLSGFWRRQLNDRGGPALQVGITIGGGRKNSAAGPTGSRGGTPVRTDPSPPSGNDIFDSARNSGASRDDAGLARSIVQTALDAMGTPYEWGGTDSNGFDCSGLIKYAYGQNGIIIPRISRDQARAGRPVEARVGSLMPGDILGFSIEGDRVTHVGLYIGNGQFIHSATGGVKISNLVGADGESNWWTRRWIASRRILN